MSYVFGVGLLLSLEGSAPPPSSAYEQLITGLITGRILPVKSPLTTINKHRNGPKKLK